MDNSANLDSVFEQEGDPNFKPWGMEVNAFCMLMHLSSLAGYIAPFLGLVLPIVMWASNKDQSPMIDKQGKIILNWIITSTIILVVGVILSFILIGIPIIFAVVIAGLVFSIKGAIKADKGEIYQYPMSITFIK